MEKLWAKVNGNYEYIIAGGSQESFGFLLGAPSVYFNMTLNMGYDPTNPATIGTAALNAWNVVQPADQANFVMACSANGLGMYGLV
jgi:hypothetical protein